MDATTIRTSRLFNQQLITSSITTPKDIVSWMGAVQAQDFNMGKWAVGVRLPGSTDKEIEEALNRGDIVRTHILRPTWHLVSAEDIYWMLDLSASRIKTGIRSVDKELELDNNFISKTNLIITTILEQEPNLTRQEIGDKLRNKGIICDNRRLNHIMLGAELDGIVCNGIVRGKKQTYDLLERKVPKGESHFDKDESLHKLAYKYFRSHGPATLHDFIWWSGLAVGDAKRAVELIRPDFIFEIIDSVTYIFHHSINIGGLSSDHIHLLPAFDELLVSYKDRKEILEPGHHKKVIVSNGVFKPFVLHNGKIIGIWNRVVKKNKIVGEIACFTKSNKDIEKLISSSTNIYNIFANNANL